MKVWTDLYRAQGAARKAGQGTWDRQIRQRLTKLAQAGFCDLSVQSRFSYRLNPKAPDLSNWSISPAAETLHRIPDLAEARLEVQALTDRKGQHLHMFTVAVEGKRTDGSPWTLAVHLHEDLGRDGDRAGRGACGHAALHCHVGPDLDTAPAIRIPMPAIDAVDAFDWVLSQIIPTEEVEPAPWTAVHAALEREAEGPKG